MLGLRHDVWSELFSAAKDPRLRTGQRAREVHAGAMWLVADHDEVGELHQVGGYLTHAAAVVRDDAEIALAEEIISDEIVLETRPVQGGDDRADVRCATQPRVLGDDVTDLVGRGADG